MVYWQTRPDEFAGNISFGSKSTFFVVFYVYKVSIELREARRKRNGPSRHYGNPPGANFRADFPPIHAGFDFRAE